MNDPVFIALIVMVGAIIALIIVRSRLNSVKGKVKGIGYEVEGELLTKSTMENTMIEKDDSLTIGIKAKDIKVGRDLEAVDESGKGIQAEKVEAGQDIRLHNSQKQSNPKLQAPT